MDEMRYSIRIAARRSGLSPNLIRVWERRYSTIQPTRGGSDGKRRLYSDAEMERLRMLRVLTENGHSIGIIADRSDDDLRRLVLEDSANSIRPGVRIDANGGSNAQRTNQVENSKLSTVEELLDGLMAAVEKMDVLGMEHLMDRSLVDHGHIRTLEQVVVPLMDQIGERWRQGSLKICQEHVATAMIRTFLGQMSRSSLAAASAPVLLCVTPMGQIHEFGAILAAAIATQHGWRAIYAGPNLPAKGIAAAAEACQARAVALSVVHPADDPSLAGELRRIRELLPINTRLVIGGRASMAYRQSTPAIEATWVESLSQLADFLDLVRSRPPAREA